MYWGCGRAALLSSRAFAGETSALGGTYPRALSARVEVLAFRSLCNKTFTEGNTWWPFWFRSAMKAFCLWERCIAQKRSGIRFRAKREQLKRFKHFT